MLRRTAFCLAANVVPPSVLVLTMTLNGGALTSALRELGYHPYTFDTTFRYGHVVNHPREWLAVLQHYKQFDPIILTRPDADPNAPNKSGSTTPCAQDGTSADARSSLAWSQFDALVGPPATLAFESILRACPLSTRVVLVEEPDKAAWESHMNLILQQVRLETRHVRFLGSARQLSEMVDMMTDIRRALGQRRERSARQTKVLSGRPLHNLSQGAALSAFEDHVKEVVPRDRLLVYRLGDGWKPLCDFLGKPVPLDSHVSTAGTSSSAPASSTDAIDAAAQVLPFPANTDGLEVVSTLSVATSRSQLALLVFLLSMAAFAFVFLTPVVWRLKALYAEEEVQYRAAVQPYVDQGKQTGDVSLRRVLVLTKKASLEHQRQYEEEGSFWQQWCAAWKQATHKGETGPEK